MACVATTERYQGKHPVIAHSRSGVGKDHYRVPVDFADGLYDRVRTASSVECPRCEYLQACAGGMARILSTRVSIAGSEPPVSQRSATISAQGC